MSDGTALQKKLVTTLAAVFPAAVFPAVAPDQMTPPYAVYTRITSTPEHTLSNGQPLEHDRYQLDVWSSNYDQAHQLALAARQAILALPFPIGVVLLMEADSYESDVKLHRVIQDFSIYSQRSV